MQTACAPAREARRRAGAPSAGEPAPALVLARALAVTLACSASAPAPARADPDARFEPRDPVHAALARQCAPELRFNAFVDDDPSRQNVNEDFFPASVDAFLGWLAAGEGPVVVRRSEGARPAEVRRVRFGASAYIAADHMGGFPEGMAGEPPGQAPLYVHVYEDVEAARAHPDGGRVGVFFCEYWVFYPYDWTCSRTLGRFGCKGAHRGDWEHTIYRVEAAIDAAGALGAARITDGYYFAHGWAVRVPRAALERVGDDGAPAGAGDAGGARDAGGAGAPGGEHPVVYVSQGKHGSFPHAGELHDFAGTALVADHDDFFRGNGVRVRTWQGTLIDLSPAARAAEPARFRPAALDALLARSREPPVLDGWLDFRGRWGPDLEGALGIVWTSSATGPYMKTSFGARGRGAEPWELWKRRFAGKLRLYQDEGFTAPRLEPAPAPVWTADESPGEPR